MRKGQRHVRKRQLRINCNPVWQTEPRRLRCAGVDGGGVREGRMYSNYMDVVAKPATITRGLGRHWPMQAVLMFVTSSQLQLTVAV